MCFFNIVRHHNIFIFNTKWPISSFFLWSVAKKFESLSEVWLFWSPSHWNACASIDSLCRPSKLVILSSIQKHWSTWSKFNKTLNFPSPSKAYFECISLNVGCHHNVRSLLSIAFQTIDLSLILDDERLSVSLEILEYATFSPTMQLKMKHITC